MYLKLQEQTSIFIRAITPACFGLFREQHLARAGVRRPELTKLFRKEKGVVYGRKGGRLVDVTIIRCDCSEVGSVDYSVVIQVIG